jgi:hypothetical protein
MSCGCKNKNNQSKPLTTTNNGSVKPQNQQLKTTNPAIQDSIKKIVEKYYKR